MSSHTHSCAPQPHLYDDYVAFHRAHTTISVAPDEIMARWAHHHILVAISNHRQLTKMVIYKGGNALRSVHASVRATRDLDFSITETLPEASAKEWLDKAFRRQSQRADILLRVQSFKPKPKRADATRRTWRISVGYALKSQTSVLRQLKDDGQSPYTIPLEISENEAVGAYDINRIQGAERLHVSTLENIIAEKLRALLQQPLRDRHRPQDVFDIAFQCLRVKNQHAPPLDLQSLHTQFEEKCRARDVPTSLDGFLQEEVWTRAQRDYEELKVTIPASAHLAFADARAEVEALLNALKDRTKKYYSG